MKLFTFAANFDPRQVRLWETPEMIEINIPATSEKEAWDKLQALVGRVFKRSFRLNDISVY